MSVADLRSSVAAGLGGGARVITTTAEIAAALSLPGFRARMDSSGVTTPFIVARTLWTDV